MKFEKHIHKELSNLPKYSLEDKQKQRIMMNLTEKKHYKKKKITFKPVIAIIVAIASLSILMIGELNRENVNPPHPAGLVEFSAPSGEKFTLSDNNQEVIGIQGNVALLNTFNHFVAEDHRRVAKQMLFFWGNPEELLNKQFKVEAMSHTGEKITIANGTLFPPLHSEDAHTLTSFLPFPSEGEWQLSFYVEDTLHGAFTVNVLPPFPKSKHYTLVDSPIEFEIGKASNFYIESSWKEKKQLEVKLINKDGIVIEETKFLLEATNLDASTNEPVYLFTGSLTFPYKGAWTLLIDGEKTNLFNN